MISGEKNCSILIMARDASLRQAHITSMLFRKYWKDCPYELVLCTQTKVPEECLYDKVIYTDESMIWGERLEVALEQLKSDYILLSPEDSFLQAPVSTVDMQICIEYMEKGGMGAVRLKNEIPFVEEYDGIFDCIPVSSIYRLCLHPMLYNKEYLQRFACKHYSPWQFERKGSIQSRKYPEKIMCAKKPLYDSVHAWSTGTWLKEGYALLQRENIPQELYDFAPVYPWYKSCKDKICMVIIRIAPNLVNRIRIWQCERSERKLNT